MESDSKDLLIEQLQAQLKQLKQVADSGLLNMNNSEDLSGTLDVILYWDGFSYICLAGGGGMKII